MLSKINSFCGIFLTFSLNVRNISLLLSVPKNNAMGLNNVMPDHGLLDYRDLVGVSNPCRAFAHPSWMPHFKYVQIKYEVNEWLMRQF